MSGKFRMHVGRAALAQSTASARSPSACAACIDSSRTSSGVGPSASAVAINSLVRAAATARSAGTFASSRIGGGGTHFAVEVDWMRV